MPCFFPQNVVQSLLDFIFSVDISSRLMFIQTVDYRHLYKASLHNIINGRSFIPSNTVYDIFMNFLFYIFVKWYTYFSRGYQYHSIWFHKQYRMQFYKTFIPNNRNKITKVWVWKGKFFVDQSPHVHIWDKNDTTYIGGSRCALYEGKKELCWSYLFI